MSKTVLLVLGAVAFFFLFMRKGGVPLTYAGAGGVPVTKPITPSPAIPNPSTSQILAGAAVKAAPQIISALGSFFNSDDSSSDGGFDDSYDSYSDYSY